MESFEKLLADRIAVRDMSPKTLEVYLGKLREFARFVAKPLDEVSPEEFDAYQRHLTVERHVGFSAFNQAVYAVRFFYRECLGKTDWNFEKFPYQRQRRILPEILAPEEVTAILEACSNLKHKALLMTAYGGGLRLGETLHLLPGDIDSRRMMIRMEQGKGRKDRYVMLSEVLLTTLREYFRKFRPLTWLFEGSVAGHPLAASTAEKIFKIAARKASARTAFGHDHDREAVAAFAHVGVAPDEVHEAGASQRRPCPTAYLQDRGSANGTRLNGRKSLAALEDGDSIGIGKLELNVSLVRG